ncbi:MAG: SDR family oxidoreductase, partial [Pseudomonadota bacterium]|nr:SDR family oxidoreductase [Pseudomonadota bacterium]
MTALTGKTAVVTGGASGIGLAVARRFVEAGARVLIVGRRAEALETARAELGPLAETLVGDVGRIETHDRIAQVVRDRFGGLDIHVANAGVIRLGPADAVTEDDFDAQFATNARGVFFGVQRAAATMRDGGAVILVSSIASRKVLPDHAVYAGAKAAIEAFARAWALELAPRRIRVNVLSPGPTLTPILDTLGPSPEARPAIERAMQAAIPLGRMAEADDLA